jgi:uncharacterized caspase-like protein
MKRALVVGLNDYPNGNALSACVSDAVAVAQRLERHGNGDKNFDVVSVYGKCSRDDLKSAIQKCFENTADVALFYFSGHGMLDSFGGHIVTTDNSSCDLSLREILEVVNASTATNKVVILDSCFSGNMGNQTRTPDVTSISNGVTILTACMQEQTAIENREHGVFTELLLAALDGEAADLMGNITPGGIYAFIDKSLGAWEQRPVFKTNVTTFSPLRKVKAPIDTQILRNLATYFQTAESPFALDPSYEYTNKQSVPHEVIEPYATVENTHIMKELQQLERVGLVVPCGTEHMYYAAMESKSCQLTAVGKHYWRLAKNNRI